MRLHHAKPLAAALVSVLAVVLLVVAGFGARASLEHPPPRPPDGYVGSATCKTCHAQHHESWSRTYHRTMTQEASAKSVQGRFDGTVVRAWGVDVRPLRRDDGSYWFDYLKQDGSVAQSVPVARTVGSHRYQQYLTKDADGRYARLHLIWHNGDARWVHYNGAFLYDDAQGFNEHATVWNPNCIFCHNTGPQPRIANADALTDRLLRGERFNYLNAAHWESEVAELGIACEACHGPGAVHSQANQNPLRRYWLHASGRPDPTIVNPKRVSPERSTQICGQCHGQRMPVRQELTERWLETGPTYRAGDDLFDHVRLVQPDTPVPAGSPDLFRQRFWQDGSPRLSAYELQSLMGSPCYTEGKASCIGCHEGHGGDPAGMISDANRAGASCLGCHAQAAAMPVHRPHAAASAATNCVDCHMPKSVYGVMEIHRSHRIANPRPLAAAAQQRPDSCVGCHGDRTAVWAAAAVAGWKGEAFDVQAAVAQALATTSTGGSSAGTPTGRGSAADATGDGVAPRPDSDEAAAAASRTATVGSAAAPVAVPDPTTGAATVAAREPLVARPQEDERAAAITALPENLRQLFGGDPVQRAVAAKLAGAARSALTPARRAQQLPLLIAAMEDGYPAVRRFAQQSAAESARVLGLAPLATALAGFDFVGAPAGRAAAIARIRAAMPISHATPDTLGGLLRADGSVEAATVARLRAQADSTAINIGE